MRFIIAACLGVIGTVAQAAELPGTRSVDSPWQHSHLGDPLVMELDLDWLAVKTDTLLPSLTAQDGQWRLVPEIAWRSSVPGWWLVSVDGADSPADITDAITQLHRETGLFASPVLLGGTHRLPWIPTDTLIVQMQNGAMTQDFDIVEPNLGGVPNMHRIAIHAVHGLDAMRQAETLANHDEVIWAQPNAIWWATHFYTPNDPNYSSQWALNNSNDMDMDAPECWDITFGDSSIIVSIMDDGIDQSHPDISSVPGADFTNENTGGDHTMTCDGHGSCVAGCVSATIDNNVGITGVAPGCRVMATRIFNAIDFFGFCLGFIETTDAWIVNGIGWAASQGARVSNSSWGGGAPSSSVTAAFNNAEAAGVIHFGAAGNDGSSTISYPASLESVNAVSAINSSGNLASFSTSGNGLFCSAPGESILTTDWAGSGGFDGGNYVTIDGTSFAAPYAAGVAALVLSMDPSLTPDEVEDIMAATAMDRGASGYDTQYGWGIANAAGAVDAVDPGDPCPGDIDGDGNVATDDILICIGAWGTNDPDADINGDGIVDTNDLLALIAGWGPC
ncbi:MAG: S8 family serine peptidase [Phycisphaerales bacterium]|nr:S8 family serine peptidase [Phycisphaerales bacterium]